jgi:hypothetical protein
MMEKMSLREALTNEKFFKEYMIKEINTHRTKTFGASA